MKKIFTIMAVAVLGSLSAMAQGSIVFANSATGQLISVSPNADGSGSTLIGTNAQSVALTAGPGQVQIRLYVATNGANITFDSFGVPTGMILAGTVSNLTSTASGAQGIFAGGNPFALPAPFDGSFQIEYYFWASSQNGQYFGHSSLITGYSPTVAPTLPSATFGAGVNQAHSFTLVPVPEPSTLALGGLGAAALLLFRRRKN